MEFSNFANNYYMTKISIKSEAGFSLAELLVVMSIMIVMTSVSLYYLYSHERIYMPDEQSSHFIDMLQEARQRALTQKVTMRVELDLTDDDLKTLHRMKIKI